MKIYTSYFANSKNIPNTITQVSVALKEPVGWSGYKLPGFAPDRLMLEKIRDGLQEDFIKLYAEKLKATHPGVFMAELNYFSEGGDVCLMSWEKPQKFCHRHLIAMWLEKQTGVKVEEFVKQEIQDGLFN
jgi:hypothetical protein